MKNFTKTKKFWLQILGLLLGFMIGGFGVFQYFFLSKVIPHGGF